MRMENGAVVLTDGLLYQELSPAAVAVGLSSIPPAVRRVVIQLSGSSIRWIAVHGDAPTDTRGMLMADQDILVYDGEPADIKFIQDSSATTTSTLRIHYFGA